MLMGNRPTPKATIEAIMFTVRERGLDALRDRDVQARLRDCDEVARSQINVRIARLIADGKIAGNSDARA